MRLVERFLNFLFRIKAIIMSWFYRESSPPEIKYDLAGEPSPLSKAYTKCPACDFEMKIFVCGAGHRSTSTYAGSGLCSHFACSGNAQKTINVEFCGPNNRKKHCDRTHDSHLHQSCPSCSWAGKVQTLNPVQ